MRALSGSQRRLRQRLNDAPWPRTMPRVTVIKLADTAGTAGPQDGPKREYRVRCDGCGRCLRFAARRPPTEAHDAYCGRCDRRTEHTVEVLG